MSDNIPYEIQIEIIKRVLDVKSLLQFRSVSKPWKSFIDSSEFIAGYRAPKTQPHCSLLRYKNYYGVQYLSINDDTFKEQQDLAPNVSSFMKQFNDTVVIGYSRDLLCLYAFDNGGMFLLWNPCLRRSVGIRDPGWFDVFGFAVCPETNEPTILNVSLSWRVQIFTLSSKKWTEIQCSNKPRESVTLQKGSQVVIGSCIYRVAYERVSLRYFTHRYMIVSFDLIAKEFIVIDLPDKITKPPCTTPTHFTLSKLKGSLVVIVPREEDFKVYKMNPDCSFTKLFTIAGLFSYISEIVGMRKNGEVVLETLRVTGQACALKAYDPHSHHINNLGFCGDGSFFISSYKETLHLLDHSDSCVYPEIS